MRFRVTCCFFRPNIRRLSAHEPDDLPRVRVSILFLLPRRAENPCPCLLAQGEAKFWIEPEIELADNYGLRAADLQTARRLIEEHETEIRDAWDRHFGG